MKTVRKLHAQTGFSLVELMIAMAIGLLLIAVVGNVYLAGRQSFQDQDESARLQETGRFVLDVISRIVHEAGRADVAPDNTLLTFAGIPGAGMALDGMDGAGGTPDTLTIRFASASLGEFDCLGSGTGGTAAAPVVVTQTLMLAGTSLGCTSSVGNVTQPLAANVEDFQVTFGIDTNNDMSVDQYVAPTAANAPAARAVRVCVLVRTADGRAPDAQQYVDCNGNVIIAPDQRIRRAFIKVIGLRNRLG
ncbi:MAG: PilW family protein [Thiobacillus sp.]|nr:PilW family protein [Thiobacillus sp.]